MNSHEQKMLTISVPTYNRADYLDICLDSICRQVRGHEDVVEVVISNNCSQDHTDDVVNKYKAGGHQISYVSNEENIGMDGNIYQAFRLASGKYVWIFSDDDILLEGSLERILPLLQEEYGVIHVRSHSYTDDHRIERPKRGESKGVTIYSGKADFIGRVNVMLTFVSGNIINKNLVDTDLNYDAFIGSFLVLLLWTFSSLLNAERNLYVEDFTLAAKENNTGGYQLCRVFGPNMNRVFEYFSHRGIDPSYFRIIVETMIRSFFPSNILRLRTNRGKFLQEDFDQTLRPVFKHYRSFWLVIWPAIHLPLPLARLWFKLCKKYFKLVGKKL